MSTKTYTYKCPKATCQYIEMRGRICRIRCPKCNKIMHKQD